jgi:hypothetical protein
VKRWILIVAALAVVAVVVGVLVSGHNTPARRTQGAAGTTTSTVGSPAAVIKDASNKATASSLVATLTQSVPAYGSPGGQKTGTVPGSWLGSPSILPVLAQNDGYLEVRLAQRPNGSTAWISGTGVALSATPYRIVVDLATEHLLLYKAGALVMSAPAGIGTLADPTPGGNFFLAFDAKAPSPAWGAFIMVTSGHSDAISDWDESGDAIMAIHGPLGADAAIGTTGARVSHGCVRLHEADLAQLAVVPPGSPIVVVG